MTEFKFPVVELVDRYTIACVKYEKTNGANLAELEFYQREINKLNISAIKTMSAILGSTPNFSSIS